MKTLILYFLLSAFLVSVAAAQSAGREIYPDQVSINHNEAVKSFSGDFVSTLSGRSAFSLQGLTTGSANLAAIDVQGAENTTFLLQQGYGITGVIDIEGNRNNARLRQLGNSLLSVVNIKGNANEFDFTQQGTGLRNIFHLGGNALNFEAVQTNAGMHLMQSGATSIPLRIQQTGPPSPIIITNR